MPTDPTPARVLKTRTFARWARREGLVDDELTVAVSEMKDLAAVFLSMDEQMVKRAIAAGDLVEIRHGKQETA